VLTGLTQLCVRQVIDLSPESPPLQLPGLQHLELQARFVGVIMPMSYLARCTQLQHFKLRDYYLKGPGSLVASTMLQHLELVGCSICAADRAAAPASWQQVFPGPGQLPHLTYLQLWPKEPAVQQADIAYLVECCSNLRVLELGTLEYDFAPALARLPGLTNLLLYEASAEDWAQLAQLTGLRQLAIDQPCGLSTGGLRQLTALNQLTSLGFGDICDGQLKTLAAHLMSGRLPDYCYAIINKVSEMHSKARGLYVNAHFTIGMPCVCFHVVV